MNIYDFDKTIYDGDCSVDFIKYCFKKKKICLFMLPKFFIIFILYKLKLRSKEKMKSVFFSVVKYFDNIDQVVMDFWDSKKYVLKEFYLKQRKDSDIIISASPEFLLLPVAKKYNFKLIATIIDPKTGVLIGKNCHGQEKVKRLKQEMNISKCNEFYSDSLSDDPLANIAQKAYIIKGTKICPWPSNNKH